MKLWILRPVENLPKGDDPWEPWYDKAFGFVVRAETEEKARKFAHEDGGYETADTNSPWLEAKYSTCDELPTEGEAGVVLQDFHAA
jgi:hypothetical protein